MNSLVKLPAFFILWIFFLPFLYGQNSDKAQVILLTDYFSHLEKKHNSTFSFDNDLLRNVKIKVDTTENYTLEYSLDKIKEQTAFDFEDAGTGIIIIKPRVNGMNLKLCGTVADAGTMSPLKSVIVFADGKAIGMTGNDGKFLFYLNSDGSSLIRFESFGYEKIEIPFSSFNGSECRIIDMKPQVTTLETIEIKGYLGSGINYRFSDNSIVLKPASLGLLPGETDADVLMAIDALPGISSHDSRAGNLNIRGSSPDQTLILFDNIPIYHKGHYFGTMSPYNPAAIEEINVQRSSYMADKSGRVGGAIEINSKKRVPDSLSGGASVSSTYGSVYTYIPVLKKKAGIILSGRSSYPGNWVSPKLDVINSFIYQETGVQAAENSPWENIDKRKYNFSDFNGKLIYKPGENDEIDLSFLNISNLVEIQISDNRNNSVSFDRMKLKNPGYNLGWKRTWSDRFSGRLYFTQSYYAQSYISTAKILPDSLFEDAYFENSLNDINVKSINEYLISKNSSLNFGYEFHNQRVKYKNISEIATGSDENVDQSVTSVLNSLFVNYSVRIKEKYALSAGIRGNYYTLTRKINPEPRLMASYFLSNDFTLKSSAGIYNQYVLQIPGVAIESIGGLENLLWKIADGREIPVVRSRQLMAGAVFKKRGWIADVEGYYKKLSDLSANNFVDFNSPVAIIHGNSETIGLDFLVRKNYRNFDAWVSYTIARTMMDFDSVKTGPFLSVYDQTHIVDIVGTYKLKKWKFSAGWKYRSGLDALNGIRTKYFSGAPSRDVADLDQSQQSKPSQPPVSGGSGPKQGKGQPQGNKMQSGDEGVELYRDKYPAFHQLDVSVVYVFPARQGKWNGSAGLSLQNVYNRKNVIEQVARHTQHGKVIANKYSLGFMPNLVIAFNF
jgi:hypothetical protein